MSKCVVCKKETKVCECKFRKEYKGKPAPKEKVKQNTKY